jgi:hypothetical protein
MLIQRISPISRQVPGDCGKAELGQPSYCDLGSTLATIRDRIGNVVAQLEDVTDRIEL